MTDPAGFDKQRLIDIYGEYRSCFLLPNRSADDWHHIYGRGGKDDRKLYSSVYNAAPLSRELHDTCPLLTHPGFRKSLLRQAIRHVLQAVAEGRYELTEIDTAFLTEALGEDEFPIAA